MSIDLSWLATEAQALHLFFQNIFYLLIGTFLVLGVIIEYFKLPLGGMPSFGQLVGRTFIAALLLHSLPEIMDSLSLVTSAIASELGDLHQFKKVLSRFSEKITELSVSWISVKDMVIMGVSFLTFFLLYLSVFIAEAFIIFCWTLLYVISPISIALFVLPQTSSVTKALFRTLIEVNCWKIMWSVLATLLWSTALSDVNQSDINFLTVLCYNIILAASIVFTPQIVKGLTGGGITGLGAAISGTAIYAASAGVSKAGKLGGQTYNATLSSANKRFAGSSFQKNYLSKMPKINTPSPKPLFISQKSKSNH